MVELNKAGDPYQHGFPNSVLYVAGAIFVTMTGKHKTSRHFLNTCIVITPDIDYNGLVLSNQRRIQKT